MKQKLFLAVGIVGIAQLVSAAPVTCMSGSLASYIALGSTGCTIGTNVLSGFQTLPGLTGSTPLSAQNITVTPVGGTTNPGITVQTNSTANPGQVFDTLIDYMISGNLYTGDSVALSNTSSSGNGAVTDIQDYCLGGTFGPNGVSGCSGKAGNLLLLGNGSNQATFASAGKITVTHDFTLDSGVTGSASGGTIMDQFTAAASPTGVPEPSTYVLTGLGIAFAVFGKTRLRFTKEMKR
jgi:hypothetical protein